MTSTDDGLQNSVLFSDGTKFAFQATSSQTSPAYGAAVGDFNGDGKKDFAGYSSGGHSWLIKSSGPTPDLLKRIALPSGGSVEVTSQPVCDLPGALDFTKQVFPKIVDASARAIVSAIKVNDGLGGQATTVYGYRSSMLLTGRLHEKVSLGFESVKVTDPAGASTTTYYDQSDRYHAGLALRVERQDIGGNLYTVTEHTYGLPRETVAANGDNLASKFIYETAEVNKDFDGNAQNLPSKRETQYDPPDEYGNPTIIRYLGDSDVASDNQTIEYEYATSTAENSYVMKPSKVSLSANNLAGQSGVATETRLYYDGERVLGRVSAGQLTRRERVNGAASLAETFAHDVWGNITAAQDARVNSGEYGGDTTKTTYYSDYQAYPATRKNALDQSTTIAHDDLMRPTEVADANGTWKATYDVLGRIATETKPLDSLATKKYTYSDVSASSDFPRWIKTEVLTSGSTYLASYAYYDGLGRLIQTRSPSDQPGYWIVTDFYFDSLGRNYKTSVPYERPSYYHAAPDTNVKCAETSYDAIGRAVCQTNTDGTKRWTVYRPNQKITLDENGHVKATAIAGNSIDSYTYDGEYSYAQLATFSLTPGDYSKTTTTVARDGTRIVDNLNNTITITNDMLGRKISYSDLDTGLWQYQYDANGNMTSKVSPKLRAASKDIKFEYDKLNRITKKVYPDGTFLRYIYDEPTGHGFATGRLTRVARNDGTNESDQASYSYDQRGRVVEKLRIIDGKSRRLQTQYDSLDRVIKEIYPDVGGEQVEYSYEPSGRLGRVAAPTGPGAPVYAASIDYTPLGKISKMVYGNGVTTSYQYYDETGEGDNYAGTEYSYRLSSIKVDKNLTNIATTSYGYDKKGNIRYKQFFDGSLDYAEILTYDTLDRLHTATSGKLYGGCKTYDYDTIDNIILKDGRTYVPVSGKPHQVLNDGTYAYTYDANGNMWTRNDGRALNYDFDDQLVSISGVGSYLYDEDGQRTRKTEGAVTTYYFFPQYEEQVQSGQTTAIKYYFADGRRLAQRTGTGEALYYHTDHLGSALRLTRQDGTVAETIAYDPYGADVFHSPEGPGATRYKFTDQPHDAASGLYYYGARYYDPILGRFISPDTVLDGLNRYAYCHDNPVRYNDPTGHDVGNAGNDGWNSQGNPVKVTNAVSVGPSERGCSPKIVRRNREVETGRGMTAQRIGALANGGLRGDHPATQKDLVGLVGDPGEACRILSLMAVPQKAKNQYLTPKEAADRITNYQVDGAVAADMSVKKPKAVENDMAKRLGYAGGSVGDPSPTADGSGKATVRVGKSDVSGVDHSNVGDPNGNFGWESYDGGEDHISHPDMYIPVYLY